MTEKDRSLTIFSQNPCSILLAYCLPHAIRGSRDQSRLADILTDDEHEKLDRLSTRELRRRFLVTRAMIRAITADLIDCAPKDVMFEENPHGKPGIAVAQNPNRYAFNLSHTSDIIVCVFTRNREIGVDVERFGRRASSLDIAKRFFSSREFDALEELDGLERQSRFLEFWTLKEAYVKARGLGLPFHLKDLTFLINSGPKMDIEMNPSIGDHPNNWNFHQWNLALCQAHQYTVALAIERLDQIVDAMQFRQWRPDMRLEKPGTGDMTRPRFDLLRSYP